VNFPTTPVLFDQQIKEVTLNSRVLFKKTQGKVVTKAVFVL